MNRRTFLAGTAVLLLGAAGSDPKADPATNAPQQSLRVLLGTGDAQTIDAQTFLYEGRRYRGTYSRLPASGEVVNLVPLEQYLYSVVSREMPRTWPAAALQAQAIVARTYVLRRSSPNRPYDLIPSQADQVYTGLDAEHPETSSAVDATAGQALRDATGFAQALYSSCCGGHTESSSAAWGGAPVAYLNGVVCPYCVQSPWYRWSHELPIAPLQRAFGAALAPLQNISRIDLADRDQSGRSRYWTFSGDGGSVNISAADVRRTAGMRLLPSLLVKKIDMPPDAATALDAITVSGGGFGHGVGMCQWGARGMAMSGADARTILAFYYPGTGIGLD